MKRPFSKLIDKMSPDRVEKIKIKTELLKNQMGNEKKSNG